MARKAEESFGERVRKLRKARRISLEDLARDSGYPQDFLADIEEGRAAPPVAVVLQLSRILHVDMERLQGERGREAAQKRASSHEKRVASYAYKPLSTPGEKRHLGAYLVSIDAGTEHKGVEYHHEGEEFIYVLRGGLRIKVGGKTTALKQGASISFDSSLPHELSNPGREKAELLVVLYVP